MHRIMDLYMDITSLEEFMSKIRLEPMDEWEEFHLTCLHYALYIASNGSLTDIAKSFSAMTSKSSHLPKVAEELIWTIQELKSPVQRFSHHVMPLDNNNFALFGGVGVEKNCHKKCSTFKIIDLKNNVVSDSESSLNQLALTHVASCSVQMEMSSVICFLIHGGCKSPCREGDSNAYMIHYEPLASFKVHPISIPEESPKPCHRWRHSLVSAGPNVFLFGGRTSNMLILDDLWMLSLNWKGNWSGIWTHLDKGPPGRFSHGCVSTSDEGFIISGGLDSHFQPLGDIWQWLPSTGWSYIDVKQSVPRYGHTCHLISDRLFLIGGITLHPANPGVSVIDLKCCIASHFMLPDSSPMYPIMLHSHQSVLSKDEKEIIIFGGGGNCFSFGTSFNKSIVFIPADQFVLSK